MTTHELTRLRDIDIDIDLLLIFFCASQAAQMSSAKLGEIFSSKHINKIISLGNDKRFLCIGQFVCYAFNSSFFTLAQLPAHE